MGGGVGSWEGFPEKVARELKPTGWCGLAWNAKGETFCAERLACAKGQRL